MADMLKFRKGTYAQINAAAKVPGTIYIAKDEKAMYVDVSSDERIRIGDFIRVPTVEGITPPFSTSALYYVEADNALLKYVETTVDGVTTRTWKQVNGTDELAGRIEVLEEAVNGLSEDLGANNGATGTTAFGRIAALEGTVGTHGTDIEALKTAVGMNEEGEVEGLAGSVADLRVDLTTLENEVHGTDGNGGIKSTVAAQGETISEHGEKIAALEQASDEHVTKTEAEAFAKTADIEGTLAKLEGIDTTVTAAINAAVAVEKGRAEEAEEAINESIGKLTNDLAGVKATAEAAMTEEQVNGKISTAKGEISAEIDADVQAALTTVAGTYATKGELEATNETVSGHAEALTTLQGDANTEGSVAEAKKAGDDALALIGDANNGLTKTVNNHTAALEILNGADSVNGSVANAKKAGTDAQNTANANSEAISGINQTIATLATKEELNGLEESLTDKIADEINAANSMKYIGGVDGVDAEEGATKPLPTVGVHVGDTYVVETAFTHPTAGDVLPGDLFIASGDETNGVITANLDWTVVHTGYDASLEQTLTTTVDGKIQLTSAVGNANNGQITFESKKDDNNNTSGIVVEVANNTVSICMAWEDFE